MTMKKDWYRILHSSLGDLVRGRADADFGIEVWEYIPFGRSQNTHMLNRTASGDALQVKVRFTATYTGLYHVRLVRDFGDEGSTTYEMHVSMGTRGHDGNNLADEGTEVSTSTKLRDIPIEMG